MASPFHRPPPFQFPRGPPSPPDTNSDSIFHGMPVPMLSSTLPLSGQDHGLHNAGSPDTSNSRLRKLSSIPYHSSGLRDNKDRASSSHPLRSGKPLVIVIPPSTLLQERGQAHTLTNVPYNRLSHGVVMPLFPSMFGQLTAVAREFNFPSTSGLCLYYHYIEDGFTLTPRISEDSWQSLWGHLSDPPLPNERRPLISGKIEFDIDHRLARWYGPWVSSIHREMSDASQAYPYTAPSHGHFRAESRTTITDGRFFDDDAGENSAIQQHSAPITRHGPRKLSLVERFESPSARPDVKPTPRAIGTPSEQFLSGSHVLSPIVHEDEPKSARQDLNSRVKSWRASAQLSPTPLAATGQTSLEPPNLPNSMVLDPSHEDEAEELNMADFTWSISSAGPQSEGDVSPVSWARVPSVHLDSRLEGSVCSTPSIQTSCGPLDYDHFSLESVLHLRISSPDIAHRHYEDSPDTPLTATSWGAPLSYPPSPLLISRVATPDIALRFYENAPDSPMTATSWGAPLSYPPSPICFSPIPSLDLGERSTFADVQRQFNYRSPLPLDAGLSSSPTRPWSHVWPYTEHNQGESISASSIDSNYATAVSNAETSSSPTRPWSHVWPYTEHSQGESISASSTNSNNATATWNTETSSSPTRSLFNVWPCTEHSHEAAMSATFAEPRNANAVKDSLVWPYVWPYTSPHVVDRGEDAIWTFGYPYINIYRPLYPYFDIYPSLSIPNVTGHVGGNVPIILETSGYPHNLYAIYPAVLHVHKVAANAYPHNLSNIYPTVSRPEGLGSVAQGTNVKGYPLNLSQIYADLAPRKPVSRSQENEQIYPYNLDRICPPIVDIEAYPHNLDHIYSSVVYWRKINQNAESYPFFNLYPPVVAPFFGHLSLYIHGPKSQYPEFQIYPELPAHASIKCPEGIVVPVSTYLAGASYSAYPNFNLYPPVYPFFDLYPSLASVVEIQSAGPILSSNRKLSLNTTISGKYPTFNIYPAVYPHFNIYPAVDGNDSEYKNVPKKTHKNTTAITLTATYPLFDLYPGVYPFLEVYPASYDVVTTSSTEKNILHQDELQTLKPLLPPMYPSFKLYPGIYPYLDIFPAPYEIEAKTSVSPLNLAVQDERKVIDSIQAAYPYFNLYPNVYPYFDLYPSPYFESSRTQTVSTAPKKHESIAVQAIARYPIFNLYPAVYPCFDLYPSLHEVPIVQLKTNPKPSSRLTHAELHAMVMMEKVGTTGSFSHMDSIGLLGQSEIPTPRSGSFNSSQEHEADSRSSLHGHLASVRTIQTPSPTQSHEIRRVSMAFKTGPSSLGVTPNSSFPPRSLQSPRISQGLRQLARSESLQEPNVPLPPRPRVPTRTSLQEQVHARTPPPIPPKPSSKKRDSLVLQRIKAYDSTGKDKLSSFIDLSDDDGPPVELLGVSTKDTLSKFPMPPKLPLPPLPTDRTS